MTELCEIVAATSQQNSAPSLDLRELLATVDPDSDLIITENSTPRWKVTAYADQSAAGWDAMVARGQIQVASEPRGFPRPTVKPPHGMTTEAILDELRGDHSLQGFAGR